MTAATSLALCAAGCGSYDSAGDGLIGWASVDAPGRHGTTGGLGGAADTAGTAFVPDYPYPLDAAEDVPDLVRQNAGPR